MSTHTNTHHSSSAVNGLKLPGRYIARTIIAVCSLAINSWAIAAFVPSHQANSHTTKLAVSDLNLSLVSPKRAQPSANSAKATTQKAPSATTKASQHKHAHAPKNLQNTPPSKQPLPVAESSPELTSPPRHSGSQTVNKKDTHKVDAEQNAPIEVASTQLEQAKEDKGIDTPQSNALAAKEHVARPLISNPSFSAPPKPPRYPSVARKRGQQGTVWLEIWLDELGEQTRLFVSESSGVPALDKAALRAVSAWQFQPHRYESSVIASRIRIPVEFVLN